ncbi:uncharacterized protein BO80DRAFT_366107 [Aspergillus ibericus CBS 121593]|uniref:Uncharacterized protein n=1 Tax=Aspergillus ibericus CBS 121593 TaxID=1448316 RepID=A0A395GM14_9EURO|nr:hypothetical protein BO80DRAFT_366107 [Aspergillus ibericus CBS 121593]RAK96560.1 hypothetical protein BO80DRAFT_366107 [Aspergillus ibericus CBS 121593]
MNPQKLSPAAEAIRLRIKEMIPELSRQTVESHAKLLKAEKSGNNTYGGDLLAKQISLLSGELPIPDPENWGWRLLYFAVPTTVGNTRKRGFLIPLSEKTLPTQEEATQEGFYMEITTDPQVNSQTAAIIFVPR